MTYVNEETRVDRKENGMDLTLKFVLMNTWIYSGGLKKSCVKGENAAV